MEYNDENELKNCNYCGEKIKAKAIKCKYCKSELEQNITNGNCVADNKSVTERQCMGSDGSSEVLSDASLSKKGDNTETGSHNKMQEESSVGINNSSINIDQRLKEMEKKRSIFSNLAIFSYIISAIFIILGFYKMFVYVSPDNLYETPVNAYVGGDAYNFIINANYATAYFALAIFFAVIAMTGVIGYLLATQTSMQVASPGINMEMVKKEELL